MDCCYSYIDGINDAERIAMNLRNLDLNLLVALNALLEEHHVTRAALRLGLSQPAMSNALTRLRNAFGDELLVRTPSGMEPTARALELQRPLRHVLREIEKMTERGHDIDPEMASKTFRLRMGDLHNVFFLPSIRADIERTAPGVRLSVAYMTPSDTVDALTNDDIDLAISIGLEHPKSIRSVDFYVDRLVCVMRRGHPAAQKPMTMDHYLSLDHIKVAQSPADRRFIDDELARQGRVRRIPMQVQHWLVAPDIVKHTDLVSATWQRIAERYDREGVLVSRPLPFGPRSFQFKLYWHRRNDKDAAHQWLRQIVLASKNGPPALPSRSRAKRFPARDAVRLSPAQIR